jgi:uncharacterized protein
VAYKDLFMKRDFTSLLVNWKQSERRKPLIVQGARQVGKTYIIKEFGKTHYKNIAYFNFEEQPSLTELFSGSLDPEKIITVLKAYFGQHIEPEHTLLFFDEIQRCGSALTALKYFSEHAQHYHIVAAGSLLGLTVGSQGTFPVGKVNFLSLYPMSFLEFLDAQGKGHLREFIQNIDINEPFPLPLHQQLEHLLRLYYFVGGMPEAVKSFISDSNFEAAREVHLEILRSYLLDFSKYASPAEAIKIATLWEVVPRNLAKENKKFLFSAIKKSARAREYETALQWLLDAGIVYKSVLAERPQLPLKAYAEDSSFKLYLLDLGLLGALMGLQSRTLVEGDELFRSFRGALAENYVAQTLMAWPRSGAMREDLFYWTSGNTAEIDFLVQVEGHVFPLEVKSGLNTRAKSLSQYGKLYSPLLLLRSSLQPQRLEQNRYECPLYALNVLGQKLSSFSIKP